jgi:small-conductance mechanosensitive channel
VPPFALAIFGLDGWPARLALVGVVVVVAGALLWLIAWASPRWSSRAGTLEGPRARQRQTAISALATGLRYLVLVGALIGIFSALAGGGGWAALGGSALLVVLAGFASQRLLVDVIAGFFILFEDQYGVGDVIRLEPSGYTGTVESVGLRTTVLAGPTGERMIVPNGVITGVRTIPDGTRRVRIELLTRDPDRVHAMLYELAASTTGAGGPWRSPPRIVRRDGEDDIVRLIAVIEVDPAREDAVAWLADAVAARAGNLLIAPPLVGVPPE